MRCRWQRKLIDYVSGGDIPYVEQHAPGKAMCWYGGFVCKKQADMALILRGGTGDHGFEVAEEPCGCEKPCYELARDTSRFGAIAEAEL